MTSKNVEEILSSEVAVDWLSPRAVRSNVLKDANRLSKKDESLYKQMNRKVKEAQEQAQLESVKRKFVESESDKRRASQRLAKKPKRDYVDYGWSALITEETGRKKKSRRKRRRPAVSTQSKVQEPLKKPKKQRV